MVFFILTVICNFNHLEYNVWRIPWLTHWSDPFNLQNDYFRYGNHKAQKLIIKLLSLCV